MIGHFSLGEAPLGTQIEHVLALAVTEAADAAAFAGAVFHLLTFAITEAADAAAVSMSAWTPTYFAFSEATDSAAGLLSFVPVWALAEPMTGQWTTQTATGTWTPVSTPGAPWATTTAPGW